MSAGKHVDGVVVGSSVWVMSEARRRNRADCVRAGIGVVGLCVERKVVNHVWEGLRDLLVWSWLAICVAAVAAGWFDTFMFSQRKS